MNQKLPESVLAARKCNAGQKEKQRNMKRIYILSIDSLVVKHMPDNYKNMPIALAASKANIRSFELLFKVLIFLQSVCNIAVLII